MNRDIIIKRVEDIVCNAVDTLYPIYRPDVRKRVNRDNIYGGSKENAYLTTVTARYFIYRTLHDIYCFSYREISDFSGTSVRRIMRAVGKIRCYIFNDELYKAIKSEIDSQITKGIL